MKIRFGAMLALALTLLTGSAIADTYPSRFVRWIVPFPPGGATDGVARFIAGELTARLGQQVIIENRAGANGTLGTLAAKDAAPDGYTLLTGSAGNLLINPNIYANAAYDAQKDFTPVGKIAVLNNVVVISNKLAQGSGIKTLADLIAYAKKNPGKINFGSGGIGNGSHIAAEMLKKVAGIEMTHIPYKGGNEANLALIAGDIDLICNTTPEAVPLIRAGHAVALASLSKQRLAGLPEIPAVGEAGAPGAEVGSWMGLVGPKGVPPEVVAVLSKNLQEILASEKAKAFFDNLLLQRDPSTPEEMAALIATEGPRYREVVKAAGITVAR